MRNQLKTFYSVLLIVATLGLTSTVHGVPAFARQTGLDCNSCHAAAGFPTLNAFGAAFKAGGYSQANEDDLIGDGEALSIPKSLNMSVVLKVRNPIEGTTQDNGDTTSKSTLDMPDEMAFLVGGRTGKNMGFLVESALSRDGNEAVSAKYVFAPEIGPVRLGIVPWYSDLGVGYFFETQSTGMARNIRPGEKVKGAAFNLGLTDADATGQTIGLGVYVWHPMGFLAVTPYFGSTGTTWSDINAAGTDNAADIAWYIRAAATPTFGDVAMSIGGAFWTGKHEGATVNAFVVDATAEMEVGVPLTIELSFGMDLNGETYNAAHAAGADSVMGLEGYVEAGVIPDVAMVGLLVGFTQQTLPAVVNSDLDIGLVGKYHVARNVKLELDFVYTTKSTDGTFAATDTVSEWLIMPMVFAAF